MKKSEFEELKKAILIIRKNLKPLVADMKKVNKRIDVVDDSVKKSDLMYKRLAKRVSSLEEKVNIIEKTLKDIEKVL